MVLKRKHWITTVIIALYFPYVLLYLFEVQYEFVFFIEGLPGIIAILILLTVGKFSKEDLFFRWKKISKVGLMLSILLLGMFALVGLIGIFGLGFGSFGGFSPLAFLIIAPLSGLTQELYFRSSLQVVFEKNHNLTMRTSNILQTMFFIGWHFRLFLENPNPIVILGLIIGFGFFGILWGYQSRKDGTILYTALIHAVALMLQSLFIFHVSL